ncbi:hypothetical protein A0128_04010 [Leptospira tipperaryensis]|uniref:Uncharacterized protein n=1 Tax=Leptospira tipperaryensis TaxID=2564040 RepID=A0A1D7UU22_9LEPT|nr:hypothetical protein A0128_04010 [Leptospira tipperaryensis]
MKAEFEIETSNVFLENSSLRKKEGEMGKLLFHPNLSKNKNQPLNDSEKKIKEDYISMIQSLLF